VSKSGKNSPFGTIERRIATRYLRAKKSQGGVGLIAAISFICITLAIAAMIIIMSIMNGFRDEVIRLTIGSEGHIYAELADPNVSPMDMAAIENRLNELPGVEEAFQYTQHFTGVQANGVFGLGQVIGIRAENLGKFDLISSNIAHDIFSPNAYHSHRASTYSKELYCRVDLLGWASANGFVLYIYGF